MSNDLCPYCDAQRDPDSGRVTHEASCPLVVSQGIIQQAARLRYGFELALGLILSAFLVGAFIIR